jgi:hypothetical protein
MSVLPQGRFASFCPSWRCHHGQRSADGVCEKRAAGTRGVRVSVGGACATPGCCGVTCRTLSRAQCRPSEVASETCWGRCAHAAGCGNSETIAHPGHRRRSHHTASRIDNTPPPAPDTVRRQPTSRPTRRPPRRPHRRAERGAERQHNDHTENTTRPPHAGNTTTTMRQQRAARRDASS